MLEIKKAENYITTTVKITKLRESVTRRMTFLI